MPDGYHLGIGGQQNREERTSGPPTSSQRHSHREIETGSPVGRSTAADDTSLNSSPGQFIFNDESN